jgi:hypothetical protein
MEQHKQHIAACQSNALWLLDTGANPREALDSFMSDLAKDPTSDNKAALQHALTLKLGGQSEDVEVVREFINGVL